MSKLAKILVLGFGLVGCAPRQVERFEVGRPQLLNAPAPEAAQKLTERILQQKDAITSCVDSYDQRNALEAPLDLDLTLLVRDSSVMLSEVVPRSTGTAVDAMLVDCLRSLASSWKFQGEDTMVKLPLLATAHKHSPRSVTGSQPVASSTAAALTGFRPAE
jgi:hypothetical protein